MQQEIIALLIISQLVYLGIPSMILPAQEKSIAYDSSPASLSATVPGKTPNILPGDALSSKCLGERNSFFIRWINAFNNLL